MAQNPFLQPRGHRVGSRWKGRRKDRERPISETLTRNMRAGPPPPPNGNAHSKTLGAPWQGRHGPRPAAGILQPTLVHRPGAWAKGSARGNKGSVRGADRPDSQLKRKVGREISRDRKSELNPPLPSETPHQNKGKANRRRAQTPLPRPQKSLGGSAYEKACVRSGQNQFAFLKKLLMQGKPAPKERVKEPTAGSMSKKSQIRTKTRDRRSLSLTVKPVPADTPASHTVERARSPG